MTSYIFQARVSELNLTMKREPQGGALTASRQLRMTGAYSILDGEHDESAALLPSAGYAAVHVFTNSNGTDDNAVSGSYCFLDADDGALELSLCFPQSYANWIAQINEDCRTGDKRPTLFFEFDQTNTEKPFKRIQAGKAPLTDPVGKLHDGLICYAVLSARAPRVQLSEDAA